MTAVRSVGGILRGLPKAASKIEEELALQIRAKKLPVPVREYKFHETRRWRTDFAWPEHKLLAECEGGEWSGGRHVRGTGFANDIQKYNAAALAGFTVLRFTGTMVRNGYAIEKLIEFFKGKT